MQVLVGEPSSRAQRTFVIGYRTRSIAQLLRIASGALEVQFGVRDLSVIEKVHLRNVVVQCATQVSEAWVLYEKGELRSSSIPNVGTESAWTWLHQVYGIPYWTLYTETAILGCCDWKFCCLIDRIRADSHLL